MCFGWTFADPNCFVLKELYQKMRDTLFFFSLQLSSNTSLAS